MHNYSKQALLGFLEMLAEKGLANANTVQGFRVATNKILDDLSTDEDGDVRKIDVATAVRRFHNKNPGLLSPASLGEYQRRVSTAIKEFVSYTENPTTYKPLGRQPSGKKSENGERARDRERQRNETPAAPSQRHERLEQPQPVPIAGLSLAYPLRPDFLAQVVVPRDMKSDEARRLSAFVMTLATDFTPTS